MRRRLRALWAHLRTENATPRRLASSVFLGLFVGVLPLYGLHTAILLVTTHLLRLNKLTALAASQVSIPPIAPFLVAGGIALGEWMRFGAVRGPDLSEARDLLSGLALLSGEVPSLFLSCLLGDAVIGLCLGALGAVVTLWATRGSASSGRSSGEPDPGAGGS